MLGVLCSDQKKNGQIDDASSSQLGGKRERRNWERYDRMI
jgi:hypothetical protein